MEGSQNDHGNIGNVCRVVLWLAVCVCECVSVCM